MPELPTMELYRYRAHRTLQELHGFRRLVGQIKADGVKEPILLATDGQHAVVEDGHKRIEAAVQLGIKTLPVAINRRQFSLTRRVKYPLGAELAALLQQPEE